MVTLRELESLLEAASEEELVRGAFYMCQYAEQHPDMPELEQQQWAYFLTCIHAEAERRKIEPLWRKAKRFAVRNSGTFKEIGKIAAAVALGVCAGNSLTRRA